MKKALLTLLTLFISTGLFAQNADSVTRTKTGNWGLSFANVGLSNWAAGGENSVAIGTIFNVTSIRESPNSIWKNQFDFALGGAKVGEQDFRKTDDAIIFLNQYSKKINNNWAWGLSNVFRTQLLEGVNFATDTQDRISAFMAPGYLSINLGIEYKSGDVFSISFAPVAGKFTFVLDDALSAAGAFGVDPGSKTRAELGTNLLTTLNAKLAENISLQSSLNFFTAYDSFGNVDTNWETLLVMKVNEWFNATFGTQLIYDDDIMIEQDDGSFERNIQFKHVLNLGVSFSLFNSN